MNNKASRLLCSLLWLLNSLLQLLHEDLTLWGPWSAHFIVQNLLLICTLSWKCGTRNHLVSVLNLEGCVGKDTVKHFCFIPCPKLTNILSCILKNITSLQKVVICVSKGCRGIESAHLYFTGYRVIFPYLNPGECLPYDIFFPLCEFWNISIWDLRQTIKRFSGLCILSFAFFEKKKICISSICLCTFYSCVLHKTV